MRDSGPQIRGNTRGHHLGHWRPSAVTRLRSIPSSCAAFVPARSRPCPLFPASLLDGKEGVDGSSPSEGSAKVQQTEALLLGLVCRLQCAVGMEPFMGAFSSRPSWALRQADAVGRRPAHSKQRPEVASVNRERFCPMRLDQGKSGRLGQRSGMTPAGVGRQPICSASPMRSPSGPRM